MERFITKMASRSPALHHDVRQAFFYQPLPEFLANLTRLPLSHLHTALIWTCTEYQNLLSSAVELSFIIADVRTFLWSLRRRDIDEKRATCSERFWLASEEGKGGLAEVLEGDLLEIQGAIEGWNKKHVEELGLKEAEIGELKEKLEREEWRVRTLREEVAKLKKEVKAKDAEIVKLKKEHGAPGRRRDSAIAKTEEKATVEASLPQDDEVVVAEPARVEEATDGGVLVSQGSQAKRVLGLLSQLEL